MGTIPVLYSDRYLLEYDTVDCENSYRVAGIHPAIADISHFIEPEPATVDDLLLCHSRSLVASVQGKEEIFSAASLAVGGAIRAAELGLERPSFALVRPPGHHAGVNFNGGFCFFNNLAIALRRLTVSGKVGRSLIVDIDLHYGNGTFDIFQNDPTVVFRNISSPSREGFLQKFEDALEDAGTFDMVACSAGFDTYVHDWGGLLQTADFKTIGLRLASCNRAVFSVLEGGYYLQDLGRNVRAYLEGFLEVCS